MREYRSRKMILLIAVALLAAALLSACGGKSKKDRAQQGFDEDSAQEENKRNPGSYDVKEYRMKENGERYLCGTTEVYLDSKGRKIQENVYSGDGELVSKEWWMFDDLDRTVFHYCEMKSTTDSNEGEKLDYHGDLYVFDEASNKIMCFIRRSSEDGKDYLEIGEVKYDEFGNKIFVKGLDSSNDEHYRIYVDSFLQDKMRIVRKYRIEQGVPEEVQQEHFYNENGRLVRYVFVDEETTYETVYEYNEHGQCVTETCKDQNGKIISATQYEYNADDAIVEKVYYRLNGDGELYCHDTVINKYNADGVMIEEVELKADYDGELKNHKVCLFDDQGRTVKNTDFYGDGSVQQVYEYRWDVEDSSVPNRKVKIVTESCRDEEGNIIPVYERFYLESQDADQNAEDDLFRVRTRVNECREGKWVYTEEWKITYDTIFDANGDIMKTVTDYSGWRTKIEEFDEHQNVVKHYFLDENGELVYKDYWECEYTYY